MYIRIVCDSKKGDSMRHAEFFHHTSSFFIGYQAFFLTRCRSINFVKLFSLLFYCLTIEQLATVSKPTILFIP